MHSTEHDPDMSKAKKTKNNEEAEPEAEAAETPEKTAAGPFGADEAGPAGDAAAPEGGAAEVSAATDEEELAPEARMETLEAETADLRDKLLRALAETENVRRRAERDKTEATKYAIANFARDVVGVADNLRRALESIDADSRAQNEDLENIAVGIEMTEREMLAAFERYEITAIDALDKKFDHNLHEAMFEVEDTEKPAGTVVQVLQTGYLLRDRLLRPAKVGVAKGGPKEAAAEAGADSQAGPAAKGPAAAYKNPGDSAGSNVDEEL